MNTLGMLGFILGVFGLMAYLNISPLKRKIEKLESALSAMEGTTYHEDRESLSAAKSVLNGILNAPELMPLTREETLQVLLSIQDFHGRAYGWKPEVSADTIYQVTESGGYLLRTRIRSAIEFFDQLYQYGEAGKTKVTKLGKETYDEDDTPELP